MGRAAIVGVVGLSVLVFTGSSTATSRLTKTSWRATKVVLPADAATRADQTVDIRSVSCASAGNCSAVGNYLDRSGHSQGLLLTETAHRWKSGVEAIAPPAEFPDAALMNAVSCGSAGNCTAVASDGLLWTETAGRWGTTGIEPALPANAQFGQFGPIETLNSVSCASAGNCVAVGNYQTMSGWETGLLLTEKAGRWATGVEAPLPANATDAGNAFLYSVSCASAGNCSAVGYYGGDFIGGKGLLLTEEAGKWRTGVEAVMPENALPDEPVFLTSVSCASPGNCGAVGTYNNPDGSSDPTIDKGVLLTEKAGKWRSGVEAAPAPRLGIVLSSISCASAGDCVAVGSSGQTGLWFAQKGGKWRNGVKLPRFFGLLSVWCGSRGNCAAVGTSHGGGLLVTERAGRWRTAVAAKAPSGYLDAISCSSISNCSTVGGYGTSSDPGLLLDTSLKQ